MTVHHPVRRMLARLCSPDTMARIVDPTLADIRFERGRAAWLGYLGLVKALAMHAVISMPEAVRRACREDDRAVPRLAALVVVSAVVGAVPLVALPVILAPLRANTAPLVRVLVPLLPQALVLTLPAALLLADTNRASQPYDHAGNGPARNGRGVVLRRGDLGGDAADARVEPVISRAGRWQPRCGSRAERVGIRDVARAD
jgi:hypothetical protein